MKKINKIIILLILLVILIYNLTFAEYKFNYVLDVANINIDNKPPNINIQYVENYSYGIKVILTSDEDIKNIEGWNLVNNNTLEKDFWENVDFNINIEDLEGNLASVNIIINTL